MKITIVKKASNKKPAGYCVDFVDAPILTEKR